RADAVQHTLNTVAKHIRPTAPDTPAGTASSTTHTLVLPVSTIAQQTTALCLESLTPWTPRRLELANALVRHADHCLQALAASPAKTTAAAAAETARSLPAAFAVRNKRRLQIAAVVLVIALLPLQLKIPATGILEPVNRQRLYASESGIVTELPVSDGQAVRPGDVLVRLRSDELELQQAELLGALAESQARLAALETAAARGSATVNALSVESEQAELRARILSLEQQRIVLQRRLDSLVLRASTAGTVIGRDLQQRFVGRPLQRGQVLLDVVAAETPWHLQLDIAETDLRHVLNASRQGSQSVVQVSYFTETSPEQERSTQLGSIGTAAELNARGEWKTRITTLAAPLTAPERPGVGV
ncbi:MAG: efflux RND transporter periplasmic adaptor subunit, partial [Planctomyces sp.]